MQRYKIKNDIPQIKNSKQNIHTKINNNHIYLLTHESSQKSTCTFTMVGMSRGFFFFFFPGCHMFKLYIPTSNFEKKKEKEKEKEKERKKKRGKGGD
jgi:hypothetical protein